MLDAKSASASGWLRPPHQGLCPWTLLEAMPPNPQNRCALRVHHNIRAQRTPYCQKQFHKLSQIYSSTTFYFTIQALNPTKARSEPDFKKSKISGLKIPLAYCRIKHNHKKGKLEKYWSLK